MPRSPAEELPGEGLGRLWPTGKTQKPLELRMVFQFFKGKDKKTNEYAAETIWPVEPKIFTEFPFTEDVC